MRALIVEDEVVSRRILQKLLQPYGECVAVVDGRRALDAFRSAWREDKRFDLVFMDIELPDMDGIRVLEEFRSLEDDRKSDTAQRAVVIMTTSHSQPQYVVDAVTRGKCSAFLVKPIDKQRLDKELANLGFSPEEQPT